MKKYSLFCSLFIAFSFLSSVCYSQVGIISTYATVGGTGMAQDAAGNIYSGSNSDNTIKKISPSGTVTLFAGTSGMSGYTGDGGAATAATLNVPQDVVIDGSGNIYVSDKFNHVIRKINTSGVISTVVGTGTAGYSGNGGPATAAELSWVGGLGTDQAGNLYIAESDMSDATLRKVDASTGIITMIAGALGSVGFSGDGGPATAAVFSNSLAGVATDGSGNIYVSDQANNRIRKIDASGIITTFAGNGLPGYTGDGGPADSAQINAPQYIAIDLAGNIVFSDQGNVVRKVSISNIISTVAGNGLASYTGDGGPANLASLNAPEAVVLDAFRNVFISDAGNNVIRKVSLHPFVTADSFSVFLDSLCEGVRLTTVTTSTSSLSLNTYFGDGSNSVSALTTGTLGTENSVVTHSYSNPGTYTIKEVLLNGTTPIDSASFSYTYLMCNTFFVNFYYDANGNCTQDALEPNNYLAVSVEVDSNGVAVDTISATSGFYYNAYGAIGDVYAFRIVSAPGDFVSLCMPGGVLSDTLNSNTNVVRNNPIGLSCTTSSSFDLSETMHMTTGRHMATGTIIGLNNFCTAENAVITLNIDPKYVFESASPAPTTVVGNTVTWNYNALTSHSPEPVIQFYLTVPSAWLTPGDTILSTSTITPTTGDVNTENNSCVRNDTVKSYDPNEMSVSPEGYITAGTNLEYTINFENTGNDTAHNIYVMDTLSDNVDVQSLHILAASAVMNIGSLNYGGHHIIKFDFPGINLLDSSHHNQCNGMVVFNINSKTGLSTGATIFNHAGIFFDDNPVVMTNTVEDMILLPEKVAQVTSAAKFAVYPNPATDELNVRITTSGQHVEEFMTITNTIGQVFLQGAINSVQTNLNIATLPAGLYYITLKGASGSSVQKFVKK